MEPARRKANNSVMPVLVSVRNTMYFHVYILNVRIVV